MPGSPKKRAKREAAERAKQLAQVEPNSAAKRVAESVAPAPNEPVPIRGEILPPVAQDMEPTRTALKRAMRARAQGHADAAIAVLVESLKSPDERVRLGAANDLLAWGFGKPGIELEAGEGGLLVTIQKFGASE